MKCEYLTTADVLGIHAALLKRYGGADGVRDMGAVDITLRHQAVHASCSGTMHNFLPKPCASGYNYNKDFFLRMVLSGGSMAVVLPDNFDAFARALCGSRRALRHAVKFSLMNSMAYPPQQGVTRCRSDKSRSRVRGGCFSKYMPAVQALA